MLLKHSIVVPDINESSGGLITTRKKKLLQHATSPIPHSTQPFLYPKPPTPKDTLQNNCVVYSDGV